MIICCPLGRPERLERVLAMWLAQTVSAQLLLVGYGTSWLKRDPWAPTVVENVDCRTVGSARNQGLKLARPSGSWVVQWDDDNYYGPRYIERIAEAATPEVDVISMGLGFVRDGAELWRFPRRVGFFPGHSTAARATACPDFPEVSRGEDVEWSRRVMAENLRWVRILEPWGLVYDRTGEGHAYDADRTEFLRSFGPAVPLGARPDSFVDEPRELPTGPLVRAKDTAVFRSLERRLERMQGAQ